MDGDKLLIGVVVESDLVGDVHANGVTTNGFSTDGFPDYELVVILAAERRQVLLVVGERQTLNQHLVHLESVHHLERVEVPDDDISLNTRAKARRTRKSYLEALVGFLSTCNVLSSVRDDDDRDFVVVAAEELLCSADNVSDHDGGAQWEDEVLVIGVQDKSIVHLALESNYSLEVEIC